MNINDKVILLCMKGIDINTGNRLSVLIENEVDKSNKIAVWVDPGHPQNFVKGIPNCVVIDSKDESEKKMLVEMLTSTALH